MKMEVSSKPRSGDLHSSDGSEVVGGIAGKPLEVVPQPRIGGTGLDDPHHLVASEPARGIATMRLQVGHRLAPPRYHHRLARFHSPQHAGGVVAQLS